MEPQERMHQDKCKLRSASLSDTSAGNSALLCNFDHFHEKPLFFLDLQQQTCTMMEESN
jgi:hypothetical protein